MNPLSLLFKKQYAVEEKVQRLLRLLVDMAHLYQAAYESYFEGSLEEFYQRNKELGQIEKQLDELGHHIQMTLFHDSLMPNSRDDLLWFLTKLDKVPSSFKHSLVDILFEKPKIPEELHPSMKNMLIHTHLAVQALAHATDSLFSDLRSVRQHVEEVSRQESEVDKIEYKLLQMVFENKKYELAIKYQLKGILKQIGRVTNLSLIHI